MLSSVLLLLFLAHLGSTSLPYNWKPCKVKSKDFGKCLSNEIEKALQDLKNGDKKLGAQPLEPLIIKKLDVVHGSGPFSVNMTFTNLTFEGFTNAKVVDMRGDWSNINSSFYLDKMVNRAHYKVNGKVLSLPVTGEGECQFIWNNCTARVDHRIKEVNIKGKKYLQTRSLTVNVDVKSGEMKYYNLFNDNKELGDAMNNLINQNWRVLTTEVMPTINKALATSMMSVVDNIWKHIPASEYVTD